MRGTQKLQKSEVPALVDHLLDPGGDYIQSGTPVLCPACARTRTHTHTHLPPLRGCTQMWVRANRAEWCQNQGVQGIFQVEEKILKPEKVSQVCIFPFGYRIHLKNGLPW